jgi:hypothetical protein
MRTIGKPPMALTRFVVLFAAFVCVVCLVARAQEALAQTATINVQVDRPGASISPTLFGLFF